jgi:hypothetical protein
MFIGFTGLASFFQMHYVRGYILRSLPVEKENSMSGCFGGGSLIRAQVSDLDGFRQCFMLGFGLRVEW